MYVTCSFAQTNDSISTSQQQMERLEELSKKGKLTRQLHKLLVRKKTTNVNTNIQAIAQADYDFEKYQGKIVRNIHIQKCTYMKVM